MRFWEAYNSKVFVRKALCARQYQQQRRLVTAPGLTHDNKWLPANLCLVASHFLSRLVLHSEAYFAGMVDNLSFGFVGNLLAPCFDAGLASYIYWCKSLCVGLLFIYYAKQWLLDPLGMLDKDES